MLFPAMRAALTMTMSSFISNSCYQAGLCKSGGPGPLHLSRDFVAYRDKTVDRNKGKWLSCLPRARQALNELQNELVEEDVGAVVAGDVVVRGDHGGL